MPREWRYILHNWSGSNNCLEIASGRTSRTSKFGQVWMSFRWQEALSGGSPSIRKEQSILGEHLHPWNAHWTCGSLGNCLQEGWGKQANWVGAYRLGRCGDSHRGLYNVNILSQHKEGGVGMGISQATITLGNLSKAKASFSKTKNPGLIGSKGYSGTILESRSYEQHSLHGGWWPH